MKKIMALVFAIGLTGFAVDYSITVSPTNSTMIVSPRGLTGAAAWVKTNAVSQGTVRSNKGILYMAVTAGTTGTNAPVHFSGISSDGSVSWLRIDSTPRKQVSVIAENDGPVWYWDNAASTNGGVYSFSAGQQYSDNTDAPVYVWTTNSIKFNVKDR